MAVIAEPSPLHTAGRYYTSGRGGVGNYHQLTAPLPAPPTTLPTPQSQPQRFFGGRGGAGNVRPTSERTIFSFDEELERDRLLHEHHAPVYSVGRGGAGNIVPADAISTRSHYSKNDGTPRNSSSSAHSGHSASAASASASASAAAAVGASPFRSSADRILHHLSKIRSPGSP